MNKVKTNNDWKVWMKKTIPWYSFAKGVWIVFHPTGQFYMEVSDIDMKGAKS